MIFSDPRGRACYAGMCLLSAAGIFLPRLYGPTEAGLALYAAHPYIAVLPLCLAGPFLCSLWGVPPIVSFFPPGLCFLLAPLEPLVLFPVLAWVYDGHVVIDLDGIDHYPFVELFKEEEDESNR